MVQFCYLRLYFGIDTVSCNLLPVADPDLQISGGGCHQDPEIRGGPVLKNFFRSFGSQFNPKIMGGGPPEPLPWIGHWLRWIAKITSNQISTRLIRN